METKTVIPIPPFYFENETLDVDSTCKYLKFLNSKGIQNVMTTAGTSQYNLLTVDEIHLLNKTVCSSYEHNKIIGIPPLSFRETVKFIEEANDYIDSKTKYLLLYPERYYNSDTIKKFCKQLKKVAKSDLYLHAMGMRAGTGGQWEYSSDLVKELFREGLIVGIKEEHSNLQQAFNFVKDLPKDLDVIVAGGSMRRHNFLKTAGANAFLGGIGNLFPEIELDYCGFYSTAQEKERSLMLERKFFDVFMKFGWHRALRIGISYLNLGCDYDRMPWPERDPRCEVAVINCIKDIENER